MAQDGATSNTQPAAPETVAPIPESPTDPVVDESVPPEPVPSRNAIPLAAPNPSSRAAAPDKSTDKAPGESKWIILATIIAIGAGVALYYLLRGIGGGGKGSKGPLGTIISAGPPSVGTGR